MSSRQNNTTIASTLEKLKTLFQASHVELIDNSWQHAGHLAMEDHEGPLIGTHLAVSIVSTQFIGQNSVQRHRLVQKALREEFEQNLHALQIKTFTPEEWGSQ